MRKKLTRRERLEYLFNKMSSKEFLNKEGLGNEVPFFICDFEPKEKFEMQEDIKLLKNKLEKASVPVLDINLYDLTKELLDKRNLWDKVINREKNMKKVKLLETLQNILDPERYLIPAIAEKMKQKPFRIMFITGVGEVFPYIRSHNILNNLQSTAKDNPTVMFFPGEYRYSGTEGTSLDLFGRLHNDRYYRAFNIYTFER